jgi:PilZ domain-containing protein
VATRVSQYRAMVPILTEQRGAPRHRVHVTRATLTKRGNLPVEAMLHDLSIYGCRLLLRSKHAEGDLLWLSLDGHDPIAAIVVWNDGAQLGCRFENPIARSLLRSLTLALY